MSNTYERNEAAMKHEMRVNVFSLSALEDRGMLAERFFGPGIQLGLNEDELNTILKGYSSLTLYEFNGSKGVLARYIRLLGTPEYVILKLVAGNESTMEDMADLLLIITQALPFDCNVVYCVSVDEDSFDEANIEIIAAKNPHSETSA